jgi:hypothetical protein
VAIVYTEPFLVIQGLVGSAHVDVLPGYRYVVVDVELYWNPTSSLVTDCFLIGDDSQTWFFNEFTVVSGQRWGSFTGRVAHNDRISVNITGDPVDVTITGYKLSLP